MKTLADKIANAVSDWGAKLAGAGTAARDAVQRLDAVDAELRAEDEKLAAERQHLASSLPPTADVVAAAEQQIDALAARFASEHGGRLAAAAGGRLEATMAGDGASVIPGDVFNVFGLWPTLDPATLAALMPSAFKARLRETSRRPTTRPARPSPSARPESRSCMRADVS